MIPSAMIPGGAPNAAIPHPLALRDRLSDETAQWLREHLGPAAHISSDSRRIAAGDGFLARSGGHGRAADHLRAAVSAGAAAMVIDASDTAGDTGAGDACPPILRVPGLASRMGMIASAYYGRPSMGLQLVAVTGTNGKSTVTYALARAMARAGFASAAIGTLGVALFPPGCAVDHLPAWDVAATGGLTTPDPVDLQRLLYRLRQSSVAVVALEASSIGIAQGRLQGCSIKIAAFTNLSHDHLDLHGSMDAYAQAKSLLFQSPSLAAVVIHTDDPWHDIMWRAVDTHVDRIAVGRHQPANAHWGLAVTAMQAQSTGMRLSVSGYGAARPLTTDVDLPVTGRHNADNAMVVAACMLAMKVDPADVARGLAEFALPPGRMEMIVRDDAPLVCVDYAHSPEALQCVLEALRPLAQQRHGALFCVVGCGGDRDPGKRPLMGRVLGALVDGATLTSDNPRSESPDAIVQAIASGFSQQPPRGVVVELDRAAAIAGTIAACRPQDVVLIAGKGHETVQEIAGTRVPFSDTVHARQALDLWQSQRVDLQAGRHHAPA